MMNNIRPETLLPYSQGWESPTPDEVRALIEYAGQVTGKNKLTGSEVARLAGIRDARTIRKWTAPQDAKNHTPIPYAAWRLLLLYAGLVELEPIDEYLKTPE